MRVCADFGHSASARGSRSRRGRRGVQDAVRARDEAIRLSHAGRYREAPADFDASIRLDPEDGADAPLPRGVALAARAARAGAALDLGKAIGSTRRTPGRTRTAAGSITAWAASQRPGATWMRRCGSTRSAKAHQNGAVTYNGLARHQALRDATGAAARPQGRRYVEQPRPGPAGPG